MTALPTKTLIAGILGTALQWYDFAIFGYLAPIIAKTYFPGNDHFASLLHTFAVLAVGYILAPLGAIFFGYVGDGLGRKKALLFSILAMAIPTTLISLIPGYTSIGVIAPLFLTLLRVMQGFVASAEYTGSTVFLVEHAKPGKKAFYGCLSSSAYCLGLILAGLSASFFTASFMPDWAWRLAFAIALMGGILILVLRIYIHETPEYQQLTTIEKPKHPFLTALKEKPEALLGVMGIAWLVGILTFGTYIFSATYLHSYFQIRLGTASLIISFALLVNALIEPLFARLADGIGALKVTRTGMGLVMILSIPIFYALSSGNVFLSGLGMTALALLIAITCAPLNAYMVMLFPKQYRFSAFGVAFHIGMSLFGATTPLFMLWLIERTGNIIAPAWYYMFGALIGMMSLRICEKSRRNSAAYNRAIQAQ